MPDPGHAVIDLSEDENTVKKCEVIDPEMISHFVCDSATLLLMEPFKDGRSEIKVKVK